MSAVLQACRWQIHQIKRRLAFPVQQEAVMSLQEQGGRGAYRLGRILV